MEGPGVAQCLCCGPLPGLGTVLLVWTTWGDWGEWVAMKEGRDSEERSGVEATGAGALQPDRPGGWRAVLQSLGF